MSLTAQSKTERLQELEAGIHLVIVSDMKLLKTAAGNPMEKDGNNFITVRFTDGENKSIDNHFPIGTERQRYFDLLIMHIGLDNTKKIDKKKTIGKRLWIAVKKVYFLTEGETLKDAKGNEVVEYFVFKTFKYDGEKARPVVKGDPINFDGAPQDEFVDYKTVNDAFLRQEIEKKTAPNNEASF